MKILGVDPGSRLTGYGCIEVDSHGRTRHVTHGTLNLIQRKRPSGSHLANSEDEGLEMPARLKELHDGLEAVIRGYRPDVLVVEKVFFAKNAASALSLGQARGVAVLAAAIHGLKFFEYNPTEIKRAIVGHGRADKDMVAKMVRMQLEGFSGKFETPDASDALALALCHAGACKLEDSKNPWVGARRKVSLSSALSSRINDLPGRRGIR